MVVLVRHAGILVLLVTSLAAIVRGQVQTDLAHLVQCNPGNQRILDAVTPYERIRIQRAYDYFARQRMFFNPVKIGVVELGVDRLHPEFSGVNIHNGFFASIDLSPDGHGTSVAGIIGANNLMLTTCGVGNQRQMNGIISGFSSSYSLEVPNPALTMNQVVDRLDSLGRLGIPVVNLSRGFNKPSNLQAVTEQFRRVILAHPDTLFVFAAGEDDLNAADVVPANLGGKDGLPNVLTVSATDPKDDSRANTPSLLHRGPANWGASVDLAAPGINVYAPSVRWNPLSIFGTSGPPYAAFSGTSASAPLVSGVAAVIKALHPQLTPSDIKALMVSSGDPISTDRFVGDRNLNACRAIKRASGEDDPPAPQLLAPPSAPPIALNTSTTSGPVYNILFNWSDVSPNACNGIGGYEVDITDGTHHYGGTGHTLSFPLTLFPPQPLNWTWKVTPIDQFGNRGGAATSTFSLQPPIVIPPPDLTISVSPPLETTLPGGVVGYTVTAASLNGFTGQINFAQSTTLPAGVSTGWSPASQFCTVPAGGSCSATYTVTVGAAAAGDTGLAFHGTYAPALLTRSASATLRVQDFGISVSPPSATTLLGGVVGYTVTAASLNGFSGQINFAQSTTLPSGVSAGWSPANQFCTVPVGGSCSATYTVTVGTAAAGDTGLAFHGTYAPTLLTRNANATLHVTVTPVVNQGGGPPGGNIVALAVAPSSPNTIYAGTEVVDIFGNALQRVAGGTVFKSTDGGQSWFPAGNGLPGDAVLGGVRSLAVDPTNPAIVYAGSLDNGAFKTVDGGQHWTSANNGLASPGVLIIAIDPSNPSKVYAGTQSTEGWFKSSDGGQSWTPGYCFSQPDCNPANSGGNFAVLSVAFDPSNPSIMYVGTSGGLFKSTDGGQSWVSANTGLTTPLGGNANISGIAIDPGNPSTLYVAGKSVYKSSDAAQSWTRVTPVSPWPSLAELGVNLITIDPSHPTILYAGGTPLSLRDTTGSSGFFKSTDSGSSWIAMNSGLTDTGIQALTLNAANPPVLYVGTSSDGIFKSIDGAQSWSSSNNGLTARAVAAFTVDPSHPSVLYAGSSGSLFRSADAGSTWTWLDSGIDAAQKPFAVVGFFDLTVDPTQSSTVYAGDYEGIWLPGNVLKSTDAGQSWVPLIDPFLSHNTSIVIDPLVPSTVYAGAGSGVLKSSDGGQTWTATPLVFAPFGRLVTSVVLDPADTGIIYAGAVGPGGGLFKSTDGFTSWTTPLSANVSSIAAISTGPNTTFYAGTFSGDIAKSTDSGATWSFVRSGITDASGTIVSVRAVAINPVTPSTVYAGTFGAGIFQSTDGGQHWSTVNAGLPNLRILRLVIDPASPSTVYAATFGAGVFKSSDGGQNWQPTGSK